MPRTKQVAEGVATIDVALVVMLVGDEEDGLELAIDTASKISVETQTETTDPIRLVKLGKLLAQKMGQTTITGNRITLTDNVFTPDVVQILNGGSVTGEGVDLVYEPPVAGSSEKGRVFDLQCYSAVYDASGQIVKYEVITYPNCQGEPITISSEDNVFRVSEYVINSAPRTGQAPFRISYVNSLPEFVNPMEIANLSEDSNRWVGNVNTEDEDGKNSYRTSDDSDSREISVK